MVVALSESPRLRSLSVLGREALAFARQAALLHRDMSPSTPVDVLPGDHVVVLLHGLFATAGVLRPLRRHVETKTAAHTASFTYAPGPGVHEISRQLGELLAEIPREVGIHLVGHSMGGLVVRWFVQELGSDPRILQTISLGAPFGGTTRARLMPSNAGRDILPESDVLKRLHERPNHVVPHLSISGAQDSVSGQAVFRHGASQVIDNCGHSSLLYDPRVAEIVAERVRSFRVT